MEKRTLVQAKELVNSSFPTIFSKEDVMNLLNSIEETEVKQTEGKDFLSLSDSEISVLAERIASKIEDEVDDVVDTSDLDFDIDVDYDRRINIVPNDQLFNFVQEYVCSTWAPKVNSLLT